MNDKIGFPNKLWAQIYLNAKWAQMLQPSIHKEPLENVLKNTKNIFVLQLKMRENAIINFLGYLLKD